MSCLFPEKPEWDRCGFGVLGAVSGTLACLTALEAIKVITGFSQPLLSQLLTMDLHQLTFAKRRSYRDRHCPVCGTHPHHYPTSQQLNRAALVSAELGVLSSEF